MRVLIRFFCLILFLLVSGCGGGGSSSPSPIQVDKDVLTIPTRYQDSPSSSASLNVTVSGAVVGFLLESATAQPSWLTFTLSGSGLSGKLTATASASAPVGDYSQIFILHACDANGAVLGSQTFTIKHKVLSRFKVQAASSLDLDLPIGMAAPSSVALTTSGVGLTWSATSQKGLMKLSSSSGAAGQVVQATPETSALAAGSYTDQIIFTASDGQTVSLPVTLTLRKTALVSSSQSAAFSVMPGLSQLTRKLNIKNNYGIDVGWIASSDQTWLSVTNAGSTGTSGSDLTLIADPSSLPMNAMSYATVTVAGQDPGKVSPTTIQVAIWRGDAALQATTRLSVSYSKVLADPIRPFVYAHNGASSIDVYNVHTASKVATITGVASALGEMAISGNGRVLYAIDAANKSVSIVDLSSRIKTGSFALKNTVSSSTSILSVAPNGTEIILIGDSYGYSYSGGTAYLASSGKYLADTGITGALAASADGSVVYSHDTGFSPASLSGYKLVYKDTASVPLVISGISGGSGSSGSNGRDVAISQDGLTVLSAAGSPYKCSRFNGLNRDLIGSLPGGDAYPNNVEITNDGRLICGISGWYSAADFWVHGSDGTLIQSYKIAGYAREILARQMVVSNDSLVVVALTSDPYLVFVPIGK